MIKKSKILLIILTIFFSTNSFANYFELELFMHVTDQRNITFPNNNKYIHLEGSANWKDSYGDYGIINCLATINDDNKSNTADLLAYCEAKNQNNEKFWLELKRNSNMQAGIGIATYIFAEGKYKQYIGIKCTYAVNYFEDRMFYKQKCKI